MLNHLKLGRSSVRILKYILHYMDRHGYPPTIMEICNRLHSKSPNAGRYHLARMEQAGILERDEGRARGLRITDMTKALSLVNGGGEARVLPGENA